MPPVVSKELDRMEAKIHRLCEALRTIETITRDQAQGLNSTEVAILHKYATAALNPEDIHA